MNQIVKVLLAAVIAPALGLAYSSGPPDGLTGAPDEGNCTNCHGSYPLNSGDGLLEFAGPPLFVSGETYPLALWLEDPGQTRWGFELSSDGVGELALSLPELTQLSESGCVQYIKNTTAGTMPGVEDGPVGWVFEWTAPADPPAEVTFYASGLAADMNFNTSGDYVYTTSFTIPLVEEVASSVLPAEIGLLTSYPNPFNLTTELCFELKRQLELRLEVFDLRGQPVMLLAQGVYGAGEHQVTWQAPPTLPSAVYLARLTAGEQQLVGRLLLLK